MPVRLLGLFFIGCLITRLILVSQGLPYVDRLFVPDDTYYTLTISKSISDGFLPSADHHTPTSGFQPLLAFLQVPLHWAFSDKGQILIGAIALSAILGALSAWPLAAILSHLGNRAAVVIGLLLWSVATPVIKNDLNGLDTSLSGLLALSVLAALIRMERRGCRDLDAAVLGTLVGLSLLARIDNCFLALALGFYVLWKHPHRTLMIITSSAIVIVVPWWLFLYANFSSIVPESGTALRQILMYYFSQGLDIGDSFVLGALSISSIFLADNLVPTAAIATAAAAFFPTLIAFRHSAVRTSPVLYIAAATVIMLLCFYVFWLPVFWFFERYFYFVFVLLIISFSIVAGSPFSEDKSQNRSLRLGSIVAVGLFLVAHMASYISFLAKPPGTIDSGRKGAKGYGEVALAVLEALPRQATLGAFQSGAIGYYAEPTIRIINLDGVVNQNAQKAIQHKVLGKYAISEKMTHFADWDWNLGMFSYYFGRPGFPDCLTQMSVAPPQGTDHFVLYDFGNCTGHNRLDNTINENSR